MWTPSPGRSDSSALRIAELYAGALDRLGDPRPPMRVGALHTLEILGQQHPGLRQAIVDVICAYLRMPAGEDGPVRTTAQRILTGHLQPANDVTFWSGVSLDLVGATLTDLDLSGCRVDGGARFDYAVFLGAARFRGAVLGGSINFRAAVFHDHAWLERAVFGGPVWFDGATLHGDAWFGEAVFASRAAFAGVDFRGHAWFGGCDVTGPLDLSEAMFRRSAGFRGAVLRGGAALAGTTFIGPARVSRRDDEWNLCPPGWRVEIDPDNEAVGQLVWSGSSALADVTPA